MSPNIPAGFCDIRKKFADITKPMFTKNPNVTKYFLSFNIIFFPMSQVDGLRWKYHEFKLDTSINEYWQLYTKLDGHKDQKWTVLGQYYWRPKGPKVKLNLKFISNVRRFTKYYWVQVDGLDQGSKSRQKSCCAIRTVRSCMILGPSKSVVVHDFWLA